MKNQALKEKLEALLNKAKEATLKTETLKSNLIKLGKDVEKFTNETEKPYSKALK